MKKVCLIAAALALIVLLVGCNVERTLDAAEVRIENALDSVENTVEGALSPAPTAETTLTKEQAEVIALEHAGLTAEQVGHLRTEYEIDDGVAQYDVQFYEGTWEYEFEIHAETGKILSFDKDSERR